MERRSWVRAGLAAMVCAALAVPVLASSGAAGGPAGLGRYIRNGCGGATLMGASLRCVGGGQLRGAHPDVSWGWRWAAVEGGVCELEPGRACARASSRLEKLGTTWSMPVTGWHAGGTSRASLRRGLFQPGVRELEDAGAGERRERAHGDAGGPRREDQPGGQPGAPNREPRQSTRRKQIPAPGAARGVHESDGSRGVNGRMFRR
jgi:hypothetical protein